MYIPHESSKHHCHEFFTDLALDICDIKSKYDLPIMLRGQSNENMDFFFFADLDSKTSKVMKKMFFCPSPYVKWCPRALTTFEIHI